jgi:methionyl aminopeptidase
VSYAERIPIKSRREIDVMREACRHVAEMLLEMRELAKPGVLTRVFEDYASRAIEKRGLESSFQGYAPPGMPPYPATVCVSVNEEIVHGIPGRRPLKEGDVLSLDFGIIYDGYHGDSAVTIPIGPVASDVSELLETTCDSLYRGIAEVGPSKRLSDIGHAVQQRAERDGFAVVRQFVGHGIGQALHEPPQIPNYGRPGRGPRLLPGMVLAIEPMVNVGTEEVRMLDDAWTAVTADGALSAHFEHTVLVTDNGPEILTKISGSH